MKLVTTCLAVIGLVASVQAQAALFTFSCSGSNTNCAGNEGGTLELTSEAVGSNFVYTVKVNNTSLSAVVTGFGFDFDPNFASSMLVADSLSVIRADGTDISDRWVLSAGTQSVSNGTSYDGVALDFIDFDGADTGGAGGINASGIFNTTIIDATIKFTLTQALVADGALMRLQRTGTAGGGSLKLVCVDGGDCEPSKVPEPGSLALLGAGLVAFGLVARRRTVSR